jgi:hypothetical protein
MNGAEDWFLPMIKPISGYHFHPTESGHGSCMAAPSYTSSTAILFNSMIGSLSALLCRSASFVR